MDKEDEEEEKENKKEEERNCNGDEKWIIEEIS